MKKTITYLTLILGILFCLQCCSKKKQSIKIEAVTSFNKDTLNPKIPLPYTYKKELDSNLYVVSIKDSSPYIYGLLQLNRQQQSKLLLPVKYKQINTIENSHRFLYLQEDTSAIIWDKSEQKVLCPYPFTDILDLEYVGQDNGEHVFVQTSHTGAKFQLIYEKGKVYQLWGVNEMKFENHRFYLRTEILEDTLSLPELYSGVQSLFQPYASEGKLLERMYVYKHNGYPASKLSFHIRFPDPHLSSYKYVNKWIRNFLYSEVFPEYDDKFRIIPNFETLSDKQALDSLGYHVVGHYNDMNPEELEDYPFTDYPFGQFFIDIAWKKGPLVTYLINYSMFYGGKMWTNHSRYVTFNLKQGKILKWGDLIPADKQDEIVREMNKCVELENRRRYGNKVMNQEKGIYQAGIIGQGLVFEKAPQNTFTDSYHSYLYKCDISPYLK